MDLQTDEAFLEALLSFITSIPTADVRQDRPWRQQQRRLLAAQFGPREVESLAVNAIVPVAGEEENDEGEAAVGQLRGTVGLAMTLARRAGFAAVANRRTPTIMCRALNIHPHLSPHLTFHPAGPLDWVVEKETRNLEVLHGQSDLSSWYFIESAQVGGIVINVTVSLSSRLLSSAGRGGATKVRGVQAVGCV